LVPPLLSTPSTRVPLTGARIIVFGHGSDGTARVAAGTTSAISGTSHRGMKIVNFQ
jgi:hypothetical protein